MRNILNTDHAPKTSFRQAPGFTLLEVMVAIAIIAIVLVSIMRLQGQTIGMNESFRFYTQAPLLANARMGEVLLDPEGAGGSTSGDFGEAFPEYGWQVDREPLIIEVVEGDTIELEKIDVLILFDNGRMKYRLRHFMASDPEA
jgi:general secretion pathway protein I